MDPGIDPPFSADPKDTLYPEQSLSSGHDRHPVRHRSFYGHHLHAGRRHFRAYPFAAVVLPIPIRRRPLVYAPDYGRQNLLSEEIS